MRRIVAFRYKDGQPQVFAVVAAVVPTAEPQNQVLAAASTSTLARI